MSLFIYSYASTAYDSSEGSIQINVTKKEIRIDLKGTSK
jgi:hypothetical protein